MEQHLFFKKSTIAAAIICATVSMSVHAEEVNKSSNERVVAAFALGTQSRDAAAAQERTKTDDDLKLSPNLFRLKEYTRQEMSGQVGKSSRSKRAVDTASKITLDIIIDGNVDSVQGELDAAGFTVNAVYNDSIGGTISADKLEALSKIAAVKRINLPVKKNRAGIVQNQADFVQYSKKIKESLKNAPTGKGITVGIISDSFDCTSVRNEPGAITAADDISNGEIPGDVNIVKEESFCLFTGIDEGRAMTQLVHDIAPDAKIAFFSPDSQTDFARGIQILALPKGQLDSTSQLEGAGADIIVDDIGFISEPFYEEGIIGDSITSVVSKGVAYFTAGGNDNLTNPAGTRDTAVYTTSNAQFVPYTPGQNSPTSVTNAQVMKISNQTQATILPVEVEDTHDAQRVGIWWGQSYAKGNQSKIMACLTRVDGTAINNNNWCETQSQGQNPMLDLNFTLPPDLSGGKYGLQIFYLEGVKPTAFTVMGFRTVGIDASAATQNGSIYGHAAAPAAFTLAAADFASTPQCNAGLTEAIVEEFSSRGNSPLLFDSKGNAIHIVPNKPDATSIDGISTSFFGSIDPLAAFRSFKDSACDLTTEYRFYGTSAAAPNAAAVAALIKQDNPDITPEELYKVLRQTASPIGSAPADARYNYVAGYGLINAEKAINTLRAAKE